MWFQDFANSLLSELQLPNKPLPRKKPTAETFSDTPLPGPSWIKERGKFNSDQWSLSLKLKNKCVRPRNELAVKKMGHWNTHTIYIQSHIRGCRFDYEQLTQVVVKKSIKHYNIPMPCHFSLLFCQRFWIRWEGRKKTRHQSYCDRNSHMCYRPDMLQYVLE